MPGADIDVVTSRMNGLATAIEQGCALGTPEVIERFATVDSDGRFEPGSTLLISGQVQMVVDPSTVYAGAAVPVGVYSDSSLVRAAVEAGQAVVTADDLLDDDGNLTIEIMDTLTGSHDAVTVPATVVSSGRPDGMAVTLRVSTGAEIGLQPYAQELIFSPQELTSARTEDTIRRDAGILLGTSASGSVYVERGFISGDGLQAVFVAVVAILVVAGLFALVVSVLSATQVRRTMQLFRTLGSPPSTVRGVALWQGGAVGVFGRL